MLLVEADGPEGVVARVTRDPSGMCWLGDVHGACTALDDRVAVMGDGERVLCGGLVPPGTVAVSVLDEAGRRIPAAVGAGAFAVVLDHDTRGEPPPVLCTDVVGRVLRRELPASWPHAPLADAITDCAACGAREWDVVTPGGESRGLEWRDDDYRPSPVAWCRRCGHEEGAGGWYAAPDGDLAPEEQARLEAAAREDLRRRQAEALRTSPAPLVHARGADLELAAFGGPGGGAPTRLHLAAADGTLHLLTDAAEARWHSDEALAREGLEVLDRERDAWPDVSPPALSLWVHDQDRARRARALRAPREDLLLRLDGTPVPFVAVADDRGFAAVHRLGDAALTVVARGHAPEALDLVRVR